MTSDQYAAKRKRDENMERLRRLRTYPIDRERNLRGIRQAREALRRSTSERSEAGCLPRDAG